MKTILRYGTFSLLICVASYLAFQAGRRGLHSQAPHEKLFRSFPIFNEPRLENINTGLGGGALNRLKEGASSEPKGVQEKSEGKSEDKKEEKPKEKNDEKEKTEDQSRNDLIERESDQDSPSASNDNETKDSFNSFSTVKHPEPKIEQPVRQKVLPQVSDIFVPVFHVDQFQEEAWRGFSYAFPSTDPKGKLFVLDRKISSQEGVGFQIHVYEKEGNQYVGSFETTPSWRFPFAGVPTFSKVHGTSFQKNSRFLIFSESDIDLNPFLTQVEEAQSLIQMAYEDSIDSHFYLGKDAATQLDIYKVFPGIFTARTLR